MKNLNNQIVVSIQCLAYNHAPYIRQCLDGFVMQKTNFRFEAIIHDDASTDGTQDIIREYEQKYPDIIKPIYQKENQYSKGIPGYITDLISSKCKGKYIALCEGDDYWTDPLKLQKQVDFLEDHPDFVICSHDYIKYYQNCQSFANNTYYHKLFANFPQNEYIEYTLDNFFERWWTQPLTYVYRNGHYLDKIPRQKYKYFRDSVLAYYILKEGKGALMPFLGGVYRIQDGGIWAGKEMAYNHWVAVKNAYDIFSIEGDKRALLQCHRSEYYRIYALKKEKKYKELFIDIFHYFHIMPIDYSWKLFQQLLNDKILFWKTKIKCSKQ